MKKPKKVDHKLIGKAIAEMQRHGSGVQLNALDWKVYHADGSIYLIPYQAPWGRWRKGNDKPSMVNKSHLPF